MTITSKPVRPLYEIAREIRKYWENVHYSAHPYLTAFASLDSVNDYYGQDSGQSIVRYFLTNAAGFKGEDARRIKAELKGLVK